MVKHHARTGALYTHWRLERDAANLAWLQLDQQGTRVNTLSEAVLQDLEAALDVLEAEPPAGLIFTSAKPEGFLAGPDIDRFAQFRDRLAARKLLRQGQGVMARIAQLPFPTVAAIHGHCLGSGLELALACDARVASESDSGLGMPQIQMGFHPAFGGTVRLPQLIGTPAAMRLMLRGHTISVTTARRLGLVDHAVPRSRLARAAAALALEPPARARSRPHAFADAAPLRPLIGWYLRRRIARQARPDHYPAPHALIDLWQRYGNDPACQYPAESDSAAALLAGESTRNHLRMFQLRRQLQQGVPQTRSPLGQVHIAGAGERGQAIAAWCALHGCTVTLSDQDPESLALARRRAARLFAKRLQSPEERRAAADRLIPDPAAYGLRHADLVLEALPEEPDVKAQALRDIESRVKPDTVLATASALFSLPELADGLAERARLIGMHFLAPVVRTPLVEIAGGPATDQAAIERALAWTLAMNKLPLQVAAQPGFLVMRVLTPYLLEAVTLVEEGHDPVEVDQAAKDFGMPGGALALADRIGLDRLQVTAERIVPAEDIPDLLYEKVDRGELGTRAGAGFHAYTTPRIIRPVRRKASGAEIQERLVLRLVNAAIACLREGVVTDADRLDAGLIFGAGFPPFRGGPIHWLQSGKPRHQHQRLQVLARRLGSRFRPDPGWQDLTG